MYFNFQEWYNRVRRIYNGMSNPNKWFCEKHNFNDFLILYLISILTNRDKMLTVHNFNELNILAFPRILHAPCSISQTRARFETTSSKNCWRAKVPMSHNARDLTMFINVNLLYYTRRKNGENNYKLIQYISYPETYQTWSLTQFVIITLSIIW